MRVVVWGEVLQSQNFLNFKGVAQRNKVVGAVLRKPPPNSQIKGFDTYLVPDETSVLAMAVKDKGPVLLVPGKYKPLAHFLKSVSPPLEQGIDLISWDYDRGYSTEQSAKGLFFCLSENGCKSIRENLNNINFLETFHAPEHLFCRA